MEIDLQIPCLLVLTTDHVLLLFISRINISLAIEHGFYRRAPAPFTSSSIVIIALPWYVWFWPDDVSISVQSTMLSARPPITHDRRK